MLKFSDPLKISATELKVLRLTDLKFEDIFVLNVLDCLSI